MRDNSPSEPELKKLVIPGERAGDRAAESYGKNVRETRDP
jgi:hypothetical protein